MDIASIIVAVNYMLFTELYSNCFYSRKPTIWPLKILTEQHQGHRQFFHIYNAIDRLFPFLLLITKVILIRYKLSFLRKLCLLMHYCICDVGSHA
jgi:hypothetical protein